jgi:hypothetical protein
MCMEVALLARIAVVVRRVRHMARSPRHCEVGRSAAVAAAQLPCQRVLHSC